MALCNINDLVAALSAHTQPYAAILMSCIKNTVGTQYEANTLYVANKWLVKHPPCEHIEQSCLSPTHSTGSPVNSPISPLTERKLRLPLHLQPADIDLSNLEYPPQSPLYTPSDYLWC